MVLRVRRSNLLGAPAERWQGADSASFVGSGWVFSSPLFFVSCSVGSVSALEEPRVSYDTRANVQKLCFREHILVSEIGPFRSFLGEFDSSGRKADVDVAGKGKGWDRWAHE